ncbi:MAG: hypothetical protein ACKPKO_05945, partial [Candidatus Fonsibacter sp.]
MPNGTSSPPIRPTSAPTPGTSTPSAESPPINAELKLEQERKARESYYQLVELKAMNGVERDMVQIIRDLFL